MPNRKSLKQVIHFYFENLIFFLSKTFFPALLSNVLEEKLIKYAVDEQLGVTIIQLSTNILNTYIIINSSFLNYISNHRTKVESLKLVQLFSRNCWYSCWFRSPRTHKHVLFEKSCRKIMQTSCRKIMQTDISQ